jgi:hypothetical protein
MDRRRCPDGGACHHQCTAGECFRVRFCAPLSLAGFPGNDWPDDIREQYGKQPQCSRESVTPVEGGFIIDCSVHGEIGTVSAPGATLNQCAQTDELALIERFWAEHLLVPGHPH